VESAHLQTDLTPGAYTVVVTGKNGAQGISLAEVYEVPSPGLSSILTNVSGRGFVGTDDNGSLVALRWRRGSATVIVRALGPSLGSFGVSDPLSDPVLTIFDSNGNVIAVTTTGRMTIMQCSSNRTDSPRRMRSTRQLCFTCPQVHIPPS